MGVKVFCELLISSDYVVIVVYCFFSKFMLMFIWFSFVLVFGYIFIRRFLISGRGKYENRGFG